MQKTKAAPIVIGLTVGAVTAWVMTFFTADVITIVAMFAPASAATKNASAAFGAATPSCHAQ